MEKYIGLCVLENEEDHIHSEILFLNRKWLRNV